MMYDSFAYKDKLVSIRVIIHYNNGEKKKRKVISESALFSGQAFLYTHPAFNVINKYFLFLTNKSYPSQCHKKCYNHSYALHLDYQ